MYVTQTVLWDESKLVAACVWALSSVRALYAGSLDDLPFAMRSVRDDEEDMVCRLKTGATGEMRMPVANGARCQGAEAELAGGRERTA